MLLQLARVLEPGLESNPSMLSFKHHLLGSVTGMEPLVDMCCELRMKSRAISQRRGDRSLEERSFRSAGMDVRHWRRGVNVGDLYFRTEGFIGAFVTWSSSRALQATSPSPGCKDSVAVFALSFSVNIYTWCMKSRGGVSLLSGTYPDHQP
ncbi:hypothetical protein EJ05DRAFT_475096 [Pseudovirgaria hyperparasitica]|uniref:Uncharacterized protein n=1 Tax=Pseudovirgaria hyperparasitica TaxID=470096 RepID=A0A6A6WAI0_9PEZI|nr:uncharacterized protein EJ05DRAFT_475096 [Pseudovirgaria hyperparasitica]KAF2758836.1 hypothetical protein EJ05DRAFT_475096 [Pseudovirgaria hyperparasitica]